MSLFGRSSLVGVGSVAAPVAIFFALKLAIGLGPSESPAQTPAADPGALAGVSSPASALTPEQKRALDWLASLNLDADLHSPLEQPEPIVHATTPEAPQDHDPLKDMKLSALLSSSAGDWATINGRVYRVGDAVAAGYTLHAIDARAQRVELVGPDGSSRWLSRDQ